MFFKVLWYLVFLSSIVVFSVLNQHDVVLNLGLLNITIPVSILIILSVLIGTILQSFSSWWLALRAFFKGQRS